MQTFTEKLQRRWSQGKFVCVGLDSDVDKLPSALIWGKGDVSKQFTFNRHIIDATIDLVSAYKPNTAFYEAQGAMGIETLEATISYIKRMEPDLPVILDAKRGDIGNTNNGYVQFAFDLLGADAITIHPYLGMEANQPFLDQADKGIIVLCRTSNPGAGEFQNVFCNPLLHEVSGELYSTMDEARREGREGGGWRQVGMPLYEFVAHRVAQKWDANGNCQVVVGATYADKELAVIRQIMGYRGILLPGIGKQGGDLEATVMHGKNDNFEGMIINSSRDILFASSGDDFAEAARDATQALHDDITRCLAA